MNIPPWLAAIMQAGNGMSAPNLDSFVSGGGYQPTMMDGLRGVGHDMMEHFRAGQAQHPLATPGATTAPGMPGSNQPAPAPVPPIAPPGLMATTGPHAMGTPGAPQSVPFTQNMQGQGPQDLSSILSGIGAGVTPHLPVGVPLDKVAIHFK